MANSKYWLDRSYLSTARLNLQHYIYTQNAGYLIHPAIQPSITENVAIADVATGTAVWLLNLSSTVPATVKLCGFDVDVSQVSPKEWLPPNVHIHQWDINRDVPEEHREKYDIVHIRFVQIFVDKDPTPYLKRLVSMLKPGGWLQWMDLDPFTFKMEKADPNYESPGTQEVYNILGAPVVQRSGPAPGWVAQLADKFSDVGLERVQADRKSLPKWALNHFYDAVMIAVDEMAPHFPDKDVQGAKLESLQEYYKFKRGVAMTSESVTTIGQKPLAKQ